MNNKEELIEFLRDAFNSRPLYGGYSYLADRLIESGVTVQKWISVKDRLPNCKKVIDGETHFKNVAVRVKGCGFEKIAFYDDEEKYWFDTNFFPAVGEVTHWCELPEWYLPEPPKGE